MTLAFEAVLAVALGLALGYFGFGCWRLGRFYWRRRQIARIWDEVSRDAEARLSLGAIARMERKP